MVEKTEPSRVWKLGGPENGDGVDGNDNDICVCVSTNLCSITQVRNAGHIWYDQFVKENIHLEVPTWIGKDTFLLK